MFSAIPSSCNILKMFSIERIKMAIQSSSSMVDQNLLYYGAFLHSNKPEPGAISVLIQNCAQVSLIRYHAL